MWLATLSWMAPFLVNAFVLTRIARRAGYRTGTRHILLSGILGVLGGAGFLRFAPALGHDEPGQFFFLALMGMVVVFLSASAYLDRFIHPEHGPIPTNSKWMSWPVVIPFVCGTFVGGTAITIAQLFA